MSDTLALHLTRHPHGPEVQSNTLWLKVLKTLVAYRHIDPGSSEAFRVMEDIADQCGDAWLAHALGQALRERTPLRRFKDVLAAHTAQRQAWFAFERPAMELIARKWCEGHDLAPRWIPQPARPTP